MMHDQITAATTNDEILVDVVEAKRNLDNQIADAMQNDQLVVGQKLVGYAQDVRNTEAIAQVAIELRDLLISIENAESSAITRVSKETRVTDFLFKQLTRGADDTWSGRGNDSKREAHDLVRNWIDDQMDHIRFA